MRRAAKVDSNQTAIVAALRDIGCSVLPMHTLGKGAPDLAVGRDGRTYFLECKDGNKPPSRRKLTEDESAFHRMWRGHLAIVESIEDALRVVLAR